MGATLSIALPGVAGVLLLGAVLGRASGLLEWIGRLALGAMLGAGAASLVTFAWLFAAGGVGPRYPAADAAACVLAAAALLRLPRTRAGVRPPPLARDEAILAALLLVAAAFATWRFVLATRVMPHGEWDAWEIWSYRARHILRAGDAWRGAFASGLKNPEYPLLVPLSIVRAWAYGGEATAGPAAVAGLFTIGGSLAIAGLVARVATPAAGAAAGLLLFGTGNYQTWGAFQYADVPLACLVAGAAGLLVARPEPARPPARGAVIVGGLLLGLAGWTKTEGLLAAAVVGSAALAAAAVRERASVLRTAGHLALGAGAPALGCIAQQVVFPGTLAAAVTQGPWLPKLVDASRWRKVLTWLSDHAPGRDVWLLFLALAIALLLRARLRALLRIPAFWCAAALYGATVLVFVLTNIDLGFHLITAGDRLMLQHWPLLLVALFAATAPDREGAEVAAERQPR